MEVTLEGYRLRGKAVHHPEQPSRIHKARGKWGAASPGGTEQRCPRGPLQYHSRTAAFGVETVAWPRSMPRHYHREGYADVVLAGSFMEVGFAGRHYAEPGDVLIHGRFDCHLNRHRSTGAVQLLCLPWYEDATEGHFRVRDPDSLARLAEVDLGLASEQLADGLCPALRRDQYWIDQLAAALSGTFDVPLAEWARRHGLRPEALSRTFHSEFGVSAKRFRLEIRTRLAWREVLASARPLTEIAMQSGFSDLAHMSRSIHVFTGRSPSNWRYSGGGITR